MQHTKQLVGAHVSISGGFWNAITEGTKIGCTAIQIFTKSNRQWAAKPIDNLAIEKFLIAQKNSDIAIVIAHASYLINLGSTSAEVKKKSYLALVDEIERCHQLAIPYLVLHPGTAEFDAKQEILQAIGLYINQAITITEHCKVTILIETMAGQGKSVGSSFEELATILHCIDNKKRIGICFDTCHAFAAGYDFTTPQGYKNVFENLDNTIGLKYLKMFHMNDSKKELGCRVDRHENIGQGKIPLEAFSMIINDPRFTDIPKILETPKLKNAELELENDKKNLEILIKLLNS